uniref:HNH endonuclease n=1 Tax=Clandestinovirus TaxID=2831644 RepID=A0A8F8KRG2_9VIRU|nr:HNH endonuclease [Clandestinovirus]
MERICRQCSPGYEPRWLPIATHPNHEVSDTGVIRNIDSKYVMAQYEATYLRCCIAVGGKTKPISVHRAVCLAFKDQPNGKDKVNHIDCNPTHNHLDNLEWVNPSENYHHSAKQKVSIRCISVDQNGVQTQFASISDAARHYKIPSPGLVSWSCRKNAAGKQPWTSTDFGNVSFMYHPDDIHKRRTVKSAVPTSNQEWKDSPIYKHIQVSREGMVRRVVEHRKPFIYNPKCNIGGYLEARFPEYKNGPLVCKLVHDLVAETWIPNEDPETKIHVNHKDGVKTNNNVDNLEWVTRSENSIHSSYTLGRRIRAVQEIDEHGVVIQTFPSVEKARDALSAKTHSSIRRIILKNKRTTNGHYLRYADGNDNGCKRKAVQSNTPNKRQKTCS